MVFEEPVVKLGPAGLASTAETPADVVPRSGADMMNEVGGGDGGGVTGGGGSGSTPPPPPPQAASATAINETASPLPRLAALIGKILTIVHLPHFVAEFVHGRLSSDRLPR